MISIVYRIQVIKDISKDKPHIFCYDGENSWSRIWSSLQFTVNSKVEEFKLEVGENASVIMEQFNSEWWNWWSSDVTYQKHITLPPYSSSCVGLTYHGSSSPVSCTVSMKETGKSSDHMSYMLSLFTTLHKYLVCVMIMDALGNCLTVQFS